MREKQCCDEVRKGRHGMVEIKLLFQVAVSFLFAWDGRDQIIVSGGCLLSF